MFWLARYRRQKKALSVLFRSVWQQARFCLGNLVEFAKLANFLVVNVEMLIFY